MLTHSVNNSVKALITAIGPGACFVMLRFDLPACTGLPRPPSALVANGVVNAASAARWRSLENIYFLHTRQVSGSTNARGPVRTKLTFKLHELSMVWTVVMWLPGWHLHEQFSYSPFLNLTSRLRCKLYQQDNKCLSTQLKCSHTYCRAIIRNFSLKTMWIPELNSL